ncbi:hypothetical protein [Lentzea sp. NBRC 105346]|uniref:hypothetical protein n=1 Tax=Lentzea sp. NBRC 105346 TaxID=3032205 RepID=UPI0025521811|nr:hypothetical protein [Lentzea sp. NBRC 105346]
MVTLSEIASMAQVKRPVVSTWRRRHVDFPAPVRLDSDLRFHGHEVVDWLVTRGLGNADATQLRAELALHSIATHSARFGARTVIEVVSSLLCLRHLDEMPLLPNGLRGGPTDPEETWRTLRQRGERMDPDDELLLRELRSTEGSALALAGLADDLVEAAYTDAGAFEWLLTSRARLSVPELAADALTPELRPLLAQLVDSQLAGEHRGPLTVADPHARGGDLLAALVRAIDDQTQIRVLAAEPEEWLARLTRRRLLIGGVDELNLDVQIGTELEERLAAPDVIVTRLPYQAGERRSKLTVLEEIEKIGDLLGPGCTAIVIGPADALVDALPGTDEARLRSDLLRSGILETVVNLPGGMSPYRPGYRSALWVLTREPTAPTRGYVLVSDIGSQPFDERVRTRLAEDIVLWRTEGFRRDGHDPRYGRIVPVAQLDITFGHALIPPGPPPSALLAQTVMERPALIAEAEGRLEQADLKARRHVDEHGHLRGKVVRRVAEQPSMATIGSLIALGRLEKIKGNRLDPQHIGSEGHHKVLGPEEVRGDSPFGARRIDRVVLAGMYERAGLTEPGDIVYTTTPHFGAEVDHDGFSVVAFPARVLRVNPYAVRPLTPRVLAALLNAARNTGRSPSAVRAAQRLEDFVIPDLDPAEVKRFDGLLAEIEQRQELLRTQDEALAEVRSLTIAGIADGTLTIDRP